MAKRQAGLVRLSKHSTTGKLLKVADIAAKAGVSIISVGSPVADAVYEISKTGISKIRDYVHARDDRRILEFHQKLLFNDSVYDEKMLQGELEEANFHALMQACLSDIEDEKTIPYALLTRSIALGTVKHELRRHYILSLKDLAWDHLDFLRKAYVLTRFSIIPPQGSGQLTADSILTGYKPGSIEHLAVVSLTSKGFVSGLELSELGIDFVLACSSEDDLNPGAYGLRVWSGHKCEIVLLDHADSFMNVVGIVQGALRDKGISCLSGTAMEGALDRRESTLNASCALVIFRRGKTLDDTRLENLKFRVKGKPSVQMIISSDDNKASEQLVEGETLVIDSDDIQNGAKLVAEKLLSQINLRNG